MTTALVFLDIDGVLNTGAVDPVAESSTLDRRLVSRLNGLLTTTGARIVLSSSWRYLVLEGAMTLGGFEYLLRTHGLMKGALIGCTRADEDVPGRGPQILAWRREHDATGAWAVIDDQPVDLGDAGWRQVRPRRGVGLSDEDVAAVVRILSASL